jgi:hypothetical protein
LLDVAGGIWVLFPGSRCSPPPGAFGPPITAETANDIAIDTTILIAIDIAVAKVIDIVSDTARKVANVTINA